jgi:hypothetical protein
MPCLNRVNAKQTAVRLGVIAVAALLSTAAISFAAGGGSSTSTPTTAPPAARSLVRVPDVRGKAFVFAKGLLEDAGFAWRVRGAVQGYAANVVASQFPAPGTRVVDNGMPTIRVTLTANRRYAQNGQPENASPYGGSRIVLPTAKPVVKPKPVVKHKPAVKHKPVVKPKLAAKPKPRVKPKPATKPKPVTKRPPAFVAAGAPKEPLDEITLTARARQLEAWVKTHPRMTNANVHHWLYQHQWVVTGATFGWYRGAQALQILIRVDGNVIDLWGIGARSRALAARALREVEAKQG